MTSIPSSADLRSIAVSAAHQVGAPLKEAFRASIEVETKTSNSDLVTIYDKQTEESLIRLLSEAVPDCRFTGEEGGSHGEGRVEWIIDPIDGTSNFAHGFDHFSISIGAAIDDVVVAGVVYDPINELTFSADDEAAYLAGRDTPEAVLAPAPKTGVAEPNLNLLTNFPGPRIVEQYGTEALEVFGQLVGTFATVRRIVSGALELCYAAAGWADVVVNCRTSPWDIAPAQLILTRAGGTFLPYGTRGEWAFDETPSPHAHLAPGYVGLAPGVESPSAVAPVKRFVLNQ